MQIAVIVPAAGIGRRFGRTNKLFAPLGQRPLLAQTLNALQGCRAVRWILVVAHATEVARITRLLRSYRITKALPPVVGGASRAESVAKGFAALPRDARWVAVHDGARPCLRGELFQRVAREAKRFGAAVCGVPAAVTIKVVDARHIVRSTLNREPLWLIQTPQIFRRDWLAQGLAKAQRRWARFPDDAAIVEAAGFPVHVIEGDSWNLKVTTREDLVLAEAILQRRRREGV